MSNKVDWDEILIDQKVTYTLEMDGKLFIIENVPARVNVETGEQFFSPKTVDLYNKLCGISSNPSELSRCLYMSTQIDITITKIL